jgi:hypothetical protein
VLTEVFKSRTGAAPPVACLIPEAEIEALHKIIGSAGAQPQMSERDRAAWALVAPFRKEGVVQPINRAP